MEEIVDYKTLSLQRFDIILCSGNGKLSQHIKTFQRYTGAKEPAADISHVARIYKGYEGQSPRILEATTLNKFSGQEGVQMNAIDKWLPAYDGKVYVKQLLFRRVPIMLTRDSEFWLQHYRDKYEHGIPGVLELLLCGLRLNQHVKKLFPNYKPSATNRMHCTEIVSLSLAHQELWKYPVAPNRMPPYMWWSNVDPWLTVPVKKIIRIK